MNICAIWKYMFAWGKKITSCLFSKGQKTIFSHFKSLKLLTMTLIKNMEFNNHSWYACYVPGTMPRNWINKIWHPHSISQQSIGIDRHGEYLIYSCLCGNWQAHLYCANSVFCVAHKHSQLISLAIINIP